MEERREQVTVDPRVAAVLGVEQRLARRDLARRVAELGGLPQPRRLDSNRLLSEIAIGAGSLPEQAEGKPWTREDAALAILQDVRPGNTEMAMAVCVADLGALEHPDPVPLAPEPDWTLGDTLGVALDELIEPIAYRIVDELAAAGHLPLVD